MLRIDFHCHFITPELMKAIDRFRDNYSFRVSRYPEKVYNYDLAVKELTSSGVEKHVMSSPTPVTDIPIGEALDPIRTQNDTFSRLQEKYQDSFMGLATLPLQDVDRAVEELDRCIEQLGLKGVCINGNVNGEFLDSPSFLPFFERTVKHRVPIFMHPTLPPWRKGLEEYRLGVIAGFLFDTTLSTLRLIFSGLFERLPELKLVVAHLGSLLPYFARRMDLEALSSPERCMTNIKHPPSYYLKLIYADTVSNHGPAYGCALEVLNPERLLFGTDYPWWNVDEAVRSIENLPLSDEAKKTIFSGNALRVLTMAG